DDIISRPVEVIVEASPVNTEQRAKEVKNFGFIDPFILFYGKDPIYGTIFESALGSNVELKGQEVEISGIPFFFNLQDLANTNFKWSVDGSLVENDQKNILTLRRVDTNPGNVTVNLRIDNVNKVLQSAQASLRIFYEEGENFEF
ncbi:MAG: hypothetical protein O3B87_05990, partial [bacterium]|nr:hypothetical protein [bacterium]